MTTTQPTSPTMSHVQITNDADDPQLVALGFTGFSVHPIWLGVDRPDVGGWGVKDMKMARRLERALLAGVAVRNAEVRVDVTGQTYVHAEHVVMGRHMNADLRKLGF